MSVNLDYWDERWHIQRSEPQRMVVWEIVAVNDEVVVRSPIYRINILHHPLTDGWRKQLHDIIAASMKGVVIKVEYNGITEEAAAQ